ncbi:MAG: hypothetical protein NTZ79_17745 [Proteobacteria bacterium]|nr:hypothetical protein [Pseudomonadota bacterium]
MSKYLDAFEAYMNNVQAVALAEPNPHRRAILLNYNRHAALEFSDLWQFIFTKQMTTDHPIYNVQLGMPALQKFDGLAAVKGFYSALNTRVVWLQEEQLFVNDWGLASYSTFGQFVTGEEAKADGHAVDDLKATYALMCPLAMFWPYDKDAKLIGEDVFQLAPFTCVKPAPEDVFTFDQRKRMLAQFIGDLKDFDKY